MLISIKRKQTKCLGAIPHLIGRLCSFKSRCPLAFIGTSRPPWGEDISYSNAALLAWTSERAETCWDDGVIVQRKMAQDCLRHDKANRLREELSCMLVGDGAVGKTSMIISYIFNGYNSEYRQTAFDVFTGLVHVNGFPTRIKLIDTAGQEEFGHLRSLCYAHVDVFILCFSLVNPVSFHNVTSKWIPQIRAGNPTSPILLVGTQSDLRHNVDVLIHLNHRSTKPVHFSRARRLANRIRAHDYVECSALTQHNLKDVFDRAIFAAIKHKHTGTNSKRLGLLKRLKTFCDRGWRKIFRFI